MLKAFGIRRPTADSNSNYNAYITTDAGATFLLNDPIGDVDLGTFHRYKLT